MDLLWRRIRLLNFVLWRGYLVLICESFSLPQPWSWLWDRDCLCESKYSRMIHLMGSIVNLSWKLLAMKDWIKCLMALRIVVLRLFALLLFVGDLGKNLLSSKVELLYVEDWIAICLVDWMFLTRCRDLLFVLVVLLTSVCSFYTFLSTAEMEMNRSMLMMYRMGSYLRIWRADICWDGKGSKGKNRKACYKSHLFLTLVFVLTFGPSVNSLQNKISHRYKALEKFQKWLAEGQQ